MIKAIIVMLLVFNSLACEPISQATNMNEIKKQVSFVCLKSQNQCEVKTKYGRFSIQFSGAALQTSIKTELPFQMQLTFDAAHDELQLKNISSFIEGKTMFMGKIPVFFEGVASNESNKSNKSNKVNKMIAESLLASCTEEIMTWRLWFKIEILADEVIQQQDFFIEFDSERL